MMLWGEYCSKRHPFDSFLIVTRPIGSVSFFGKDARHPGVGVACNKQGILTDALSYTLNKTARVSLQLVSLARLRVSCLTGLWCTIL